MLEGLVRHMCSRRRTGRLRPQKSLCLLTQAESTEQIVVDIAQSLAFVVDSHRSTAAAVSSLATKRYDAVVCSLGRGQDDACWPILQQLRGGSTFVVVYSATAVDCPRIRLDCFGSGANMVTNDPHALQTALQTVAEQGNTIEAEPTYTCPKCGLAGLTEYQLHKHYPMYHSSQGNIDAICPICNHSCLAKRGGPDVHIHNNHGPVEDREPTFPPFACFAWVVCQRESDGKFLMVNEPAGLCRNWDKARYSGSVPGFWLPAGRVDSGETLVEAAVRETREEAGIDAEVTGFLCFTPGSHQTPRCVLFARPTDENAQPKSVPDFESVGAMWVSAADLAKLNEDDYRSADPAYYFPRVVSGELKPNSIFTPEWREFEEVIKKLVSVDAEALDARCLSALDGAFRKLQRAYPRLIDTKC